MTLWCPILPDRRRKFEMIMQSLAKGWPGAKVCYGAPPNDMNPVVIYGQAWGSDVLLKQAIATGRGYWHVDNGFWHAGRGKPEGYYRFCMRSMTPRSLFGVDSSRWNKLGIEMKPWRESGAHVLLALPGNDYGQGMGMNMVDWIVYAKNELPRRTERPIIARPRQTDVPLEHHLKNCWAVVTHSSNFAVDAVTAGIPVFVAPTSAAAPVGNLNWDRLDDPVRPERGWWANSLACQQFTPAEMANGTAYNTLLALKKLAA